MKILFIDRDLPVAANCAGYCELIGHDVLPIFTVENAIQKLGNGIIRPDCVVVDLYRSEVYKIRELTNSVQHHTTIIIWSFTPQEIEVELGSDHLSHCLSISKNSGASPILNVFKELISRPHCTNRRSYLYET